MSHRRPSSAGCAMLLATQLVVRPLAEGRHVQPPRARVCAASLPAHSGGGGAGGRSQQAYNGRRNSEAR